MELTRGQEEGLSIAIQRYKNKEPYTTIAGMAGCGKTTLIRFIIDALELDQEDVAYISFTGKAAQVLRNNGCPNATTAHRLLYKSVPKKDGTFYHIPKDFIGDYKLIVVDEISMLPDNLWKLLLSHKIHVIACGDPAQLEPIGEDNHVLDHPHVFLDEIMRQAKESEIIRLTMDIRERKPIKPYHGKEINIVRYEDFCDGMITWADQAICGKNNTRYSLNDLARRKLFGDDVLSSPIVGDKVICLRNDWERVNETGDALVNGLTGTIQGMSKRFDPTLNTACRIDFSPDTADEEEKLLDSSFHDLLIDWKLITTHEQTISKENYRLMPWWVKKQLHQFDYGYVITGHKSQGSQWPKVLVIEEMLKSTDHARWLYTTCTRASDKLTVVMKE